MKYQIEMKFSFSINVVYNTLIYKMLRCLFWFILVYFCLKIYLFLKYFSKSQKVILEIII